MKLFGLTGYPLAHSRSPGIFSEIFLRRGIKDAMFQLFPLEDIRGIRALVRTNDIRGFSVTIPHKTAIIQYLDEVDKDAAAIGAVNTVKVKQTKGKLFLKGYNTDAPAFLETLKAFGDLSGIQALVLGSGGAAKAVCNALETLDMPYLIVSRDPGQTGQAAYNSITADILGRHLLIINTTPLGMFPGTGTYPAIPYEHLTKDHLVYDLIYNPAETLFLQKARAQGAKTKNGMEMLKIQADLSWKIWNEI